MANAQKFPATSPLGRFVEGDLWTPQEKDTDGNLRVVKHGPNAGKPNPQYFIGLAVEKWVLNPQTGQYIENPDMASFWAFLDSIARRSWPNLFPNGGPCVSGDFAWKIRDGDGFVKKGKNAGKPLSDRPGFKNCWIIGFGSSFAPQVIMETQPGMFAEVTDKNLVKRGYYGRVGLSVSSNESTQTPGLYLNLEKFQLLGRGEEIVSGLSAAEVFGGNNTLAAAYVPAGMQMLTAADMQGAPAGLAGHAGAAPQMGGAPMGQPGPQTGFPQGGPAPMAGAPMPGPAGAPVAGVPGQFPAAGSAPGATGYPSSPGFPQAGTPATGVPGQFPAVGLPVAGSPQPGFPQPGALHPGAAGNGAPMQAAGAIPGGPAPVSPSNGAPAYSGFMGQKVMLPAAGGVPYEQFISQGWTDDAMVAQGYMAIQG